MQLSRKTLRFVEDNECIRIRWGLFAISTEKCFGSLCNGCELLLSEYVGVADRISVVLKLESNVLKWQLFRNYSFRIVQYRNDTIVISANVNLNCSFTYIYLSISMCFKRCLLPTCWFINVWFVKLQSKN